MKVHASLLLPLYNMGYIATLTLESLCNQKTQYNWELLICEEPSDNMLGSDTLFKYNNRLKDANCIDIKYKLLNDWVPMGKKLYLLNKILANSICVLRIDGDDYHRSGLIEDTCNAFLNGCDYYDEQCGYFYSFTSKKTILYNPKEGYKHPCRLHKAYATHLFKKIPDNDVKISTDIFTYKFAVNKTSKKFRNINIYDDGVFTDGYNIMSSRESFYHNPNNIFEEVDFDIREKIPIIKKYESANFNTNFSISNL